MIAYVIKNNQRGQTMVSHDGKWNANKSKKEQNLYYVDTIKRVGLEKQIR